MQINWQYFFGGHGKAGKTYWRYYKAEIDGQRVEKCASNTGVKYSIGNMDEAKEKYKTEEELIESVKKHSK